jgi:hypothetical protein
MPSNLDFLRQRVTYQFPDRDVDRRRPNLPTALFSVRPEDVLWIISPQIPQGGMFPPFPSYQSRAFWIIDLCRRLHRNFLDPGFTKKIHVATGKLAICGFPVIPGSLG